MNGNVSVNLRCGSNLNATEWKWKKSAQWILTQQKKTRIQPRLTADCILGFQEKMPSFSIPLLYTRCVHLFFSTRSLSTNHKLKWMSHPWTAINFSAFFCMNYGFFVYKIMQIIHYYWFLWNILMFIEIILISKEHSFSGSFLTFYFFFIKTKLFLTEIFLSIPNNFIY